MMNFRNWPKLVNVSVGANVRLSTDDFTNAFKDMPNLQNIELPNGIKNMTRIAYNAVYLQNAICSDSVTSMFYSYTYCNGLTEAVCGPNVNSFRNTYMNCANLKTAVCGPNVTTMDGTYQHCTSLTEAVCGPNVTNMHLTYNGCTNLTTAVCGDKVTDLSQTYKSCINLSTPVCGPNVVNMITTYWNCPNLTTAICGDKVTNMSNTYKSCKNLTTAVCGPNVTNMSWTYQNCPNIQGNAYLLSNNISNMTNCFNGRNTSNILNIYVTDGSTSLATCLTNNSKSMTGTTITWTDDLSANNRYYNTTYNVYIYPVANVEEARIANGN